MSAKGRSAKLFVEGNDDQHAIANLLARSEIEFREDERVAEIVKAGSVEKLIGVIDTAIQANVGGRVGFVLDADQSVEDRWKAVHERLRRVGLKDPLTLPESGFHARVEEFHVEVGVWIMPNNKRAGKLEDFLRELVDEGDALISHAEWSTDAAKQAHDASFSEPDRIKAVVHAWLAWQAEPGLPFGTAIKAKYFLDDVEVAQNSSIGIGISMGSRMPRPQVDDPVSTCLKFQHRPFGKGGGLASRVTVGVDEVPDDGAFDPEASAGPADPDASVVVDVAVTRGAGQHRSTLVAVDRLGGQPRRGLPERLGIGLPEPKRLGVAIAEDWVGLGAVGHDHERGIIERAGLIAGVAGPRDQVPIQPPAIGIEQDLGQHNPTVLSPGR